MHPNLSGVPLEWLLAMWGREELNEQFGKHPSHDEAPTKAELDAAIAAALSDQTEEELTDPWLAEDLDEDELSFTRWTSLSDEEIENEVRRICRASKNDQQVKDRLRSELGYPYGAAVTSTSDGLSRMTMVMLHGPRGNTISI